MTVDRGLLGWGIFLICLGVVPLAVEAGWLDAGQVDGVWRLWPLILVGIGLGIVLRLTRLAWLGGALVAATFGLLLGGLLAVGSEGFTGACVGGGARTQSSRSGLATGDEFRLDVELTCGDLAVRRGTQSTWLVQITHAQGREPVIEGSTSSLRLRPDYRSDGLFVLAREPRNDWQVSVPAAPGLAVGATLNAAKGSLTLGPGVVESVGATLNAADATIDLSDVTTPTPMDLGLTFNAASGRLDLPAATVSGGVTLNLSSLTICFAEDANVRLEHDGTLSSLDTDGADLVRQGDSWVSPGYESATARIDLHVSSTVSSLTVTQGPC
jgi:hypothetical protein